MEATAHRTSLVPQTLPSSQPRSLSQPSSVRPAIGDSSIPAPSARRPMHAHEARMQGSPSQFNMQAAAPSQQRPALRERPAQDAFPNLDHDWDVPAFQRKQR